MKAMLRKGRISDDFHKAFMDRSTGIRDRIHRLISKENMPREEIEEEIEFEAMEHDSGIELEAEEEVVSDLESGLDMEDILLEEEVLILEESPH